MRLLASIATLALLCCVHSVPVPTAEVSVNPCTLDALYNVQYFHPSARDTREYIQCDPWGAMSVKMCPEGSVFDPLVIDCMYANRTVKNVTFPIDDSFLNETFPEQQLNASANSLCSYIGNYTCQNAGICTQIDEGFHCLCLSGFTGAYCETPLASSTGVFGFMVNSSFSLDLYRLNRVLSNSSMPSNMSMEFDLTFNGSELIDEATRARIATYLSQYHNGTMRFDSMVNFFIEDFMSIIFPDAFLMREFAFVPEIQMGFSNVIPRLLMITKYTYDNFERLFAIYEDILVRLADYLLLKSPQIKDEAIAFHEIYDMLNAKLDKMYNVTESAKLTIDMEKMTMRQLFVERLRAELNSTLFASYELFRGLVNLQDILSRQQQFGNISMEQMGYAISNFTVQPETVILINDIMMRSTQLWDIMTYYGFSSVLQRFVPVPVMPTAGALKSLVDETVKADAFKSDMDDNVDDKEERDVEDLDIDDQFPAPEKLVSSENATVGVTAKLVDDVSHHVDELKTVVPAMPVDKNVTVVSEFLRADNSSATRSVVNMTMVPAAQKAENETVVLRALAADNSSVESVSVVTPAAQVAENVTVVTPAAQVAENVTVVTPAAQVAENFTVTPARLMADNSTVVGSVENSTVVPRALVAEKVTVVPAMPVDKNVTVV